MRAVFGPWAADRRDGCAFCHKLVAIVGSLSRREPWCGHVECSVTFQSFLVEVCACTIRPGVGNAPTRPRRGWMVRCSQGDCHGDFQGNARKIDRIGAAVLWPIRFSLPLCAEQLWIASGNLRWLKRLASSLQTLREWPERAIVVNMSQCGRSSGGATENPSLSWVAALTAKLETGYKSRILLDLFACRP